MRREPRARVGHRAGIAAVVLMLVPIHAGCERVTAPGPAMKTSASSRGAVPMSSATGTPAPPAFVDVARESGVSFVWHSGHTGRFLNPEIVGGGVGLIDYDGDGDLDLYFVQGGSALERVGRPGGPSNRLYRNDGAMRFEDVTESAGVGDTRYGFGVAVGDYDNDGRCDLYITNLGRNTLYRNRGDGTFEDVTEHAGVGEGRWSTAAGFVDFDGDGHLDLYVCNYINWSPELERDCRAAWDEPDYCSPTVYRSPARDTLYRNNGDGTFEDVTERLGIDSAIGTALGLCFSDFDGDGRMDFFVANDAMMNQLWVRGDDGVFREEALARGCATDEAGQVKAGMGVAAADLDLDGDLEVMVVNLQRETDSLFRNEGAYFRDATAAMRLTAPSRPFTRFGVGLFDFDHDGLLDAYYANGRVQRHAGARRGSSAVGDGATDPYAESNLLLRGVGPARSGASARVFAGASSAPAPVPAAHAANESDADVRAAVPSPTITFREWLPRGGTAEQLIATSRGAAFGDLDGDGAIDIVVVNRDALAYVLKNVAGERALEDGTSPASSRDGRHWIMVQALETSGRNALGAVITFEVAGPTGESGEGSVGRDAQMEAAAEVEAGAIGNMRSARSTRRIRRDVAPTQSYCASNDPRVHLGLGSVDRVDAIEVRWVDGVVERFPGAAAGQVVTVRRGEGIAVE